MPDLWTHILCGNRAIEKFDDEKLYSEIQNRINLFQLGTQGPDIFYYYRFWRGFNTSENRILGKLLHTKSTGEFIINCLKYLKNIGNNKEYMELLTYMTGFISHYTLDSITHPYIYYYAFSQSNEGSRSYLAHSYHKKLEVLIDSIYLSRNNDLNPEGIPSYNAINVGVNIPDIIADCLKKQIKYTYNFSISSSLINNAYRDMKTGLRLLYDPINFKLNLVKLMEKILKTPEKFSCVFCPKYLNKDYDYLNDIHKEWIHPYNNFRICRESFDDLFNLAVHESKRRIYASISFINDRINEIDLRYFFPDISYLTGM